MSSLEESRVREQVDSTRHTCTSASVAGADTDLRVRQGWGHAEESEMHRLGKELVQLQV